MGAPLSKNADLKPGTILQDNSKRGKGRQVKLLNSINPMGLGIGPWWTVENTITGRKTVIRENRLKDNPRWSFAEVLNDEGKRA